MSALASTRLSAVTVASAIYVLSRNRSTRRYDFGCVGATCNIWCGTNRLTHAIDNLTNVKTNAEASRSRI